MDFRRMPIEIEAPEEKGYGSILYNLAESSVRDLALKDLGLNLDELVLFYGEHRGKKELRELIIDKNENLKTENVLVCQSAAMALFIIHTTLLSSDEHLIVIRPNYGTNLETPRAIGSQMSIVDLAFEHNFDLDIQQIEAAIRPNTKLVSITNPHNPTGKVFSEELIQALISLAEKHNFYLLVDETYRELNFQSTLKSYSATHSKQVISVCSLSKAYGLPGIRIGWIICRDTTLMQQFLAAKEQMIICNSVIDEEIAYQALLQKDRLIPATHAHIRQNFEVLKQWFAQQNYLEWNEPSAGVVCFPRLKSHYKIDIELFYETLHQKYQTVVGVGHWFERDKTYMRIGFGYPTQEELSIGLNNINILFENLIIP